MRYLLFIGIVFFFISCTDEVIVKPNAALRLEYPKGSYTRSKMIRPYSFLKNEHATIEEKRNNGLEVNYPGMKATVFITYREVNENLIPLLKDAQKLAYGHNKKANSIPEQPFVNPDNKSYGMLYMINGDAASQAQFYITDSINHFVTGALYFDATPNYDSIYPAVQYIREDMRTMMETMEWEQ